MRKSTIVCRIAQFFKNHIMKKCLLMISAIAVMATELTITATPSYSVSSTSKAQSACLAAVAKEVGTSASKLSVIHAKETSKGVEVHVKVPGAEKHWLCTSTKNGTVKKGSVMYGGEG